MATFGDRLRLLREQRGLTQRDLARALSLAHGTIANYEIGRRTPEWPDVKRIAAFFGVPIEFLVGDPAKSVEARNPDGDTLRLNFVPVLGRPPAGKPIPTDQNFECLVPLPEGIDADFAVRVSGDSMEPELEDGQIVFCISAARQEPQHGDMVVALLDGEVTLKWLLQAADGSWFLRASNPRYPDLPLRSRDGRIQAVVVATLGGKPRYMGERR